MLRVPWRAASAYADLLANPELSSDGFLLSGFAKGIDLGTCGETSDWVWTGSEFRLFHATEMRECNVVPRQNWPTLYEARLGS